MRQLVGKLYSDWTTGKVPVLDFSRHGGLLLFFEPYVEVAVKTQLIQAFRNSGSQVPSNVRSNSK